MPKVLLAANAEHGQANVFLATGHTLQALDATVDVHFASFAPISQAVSAASQYSAQCSQGARPWTFHELDGLCLFDRVLKELQANGLGDALTKPLSFFQIISTLKTSPHFLMPWNGPEWIRIYKSFIRVVEQIKPDVIVVDALFSPAVSACHHLKLKYILLSPNTIKEFAGRFQPRLAAIWKYPITGSAHPFPLPKRKVPVNIFFVFLQVWFVMTNRHIRAVTAHVKRELGADVITFVSIASKPPAGKKILVGNRPEIDFPLVVPPHLTTCGPIIRPAAPVSEVDPELDAWLKRGPTIFVNLGTLKQMDEGEALEIGQTLQHILRLADAWTEKRRNGEDRADIAGVPGELQVIWKLKKREDLNYETGPGSRLYEGLKQWIETDRVRILNWIKPEPSAVLRTGTIVVSVNHGGANSYNDAVTAGIPQVLLPCWLDCYDFGSRVEYLGIGYWANKKSKPRCSAKELQPCLEDVVFGDKGEQMRKRARELAAICAERPGATVAASAILEEVEGREKEVK